MLKSGIGIMALKSSHRKKSYGRKYESVKEVSLLSDKRRMVTDNPVNNK